MASCTARSSLSYGLYFCCERAELMRDETQGLPNVANTLMQSGDN